MKIVIRSRKSLENMSKRPFSKGVAIISITDVNDTPVDLEYKPNFLLRLAFDDVDNDVFADESFDELTQEEIAGIEKRYNMFSEEQADEIASFYENNKTNISLLICQCEHGQSRSAAVAAAILEFRSRRGIQIFADDRYYPNKVVFRKVLSALKTK
jgi:predicted protein tyrosine phosphatase